MALKLNLDRKYKHPVEIKYYNDAGQIQTGTFTGIFRVTKLTDFEGDDKRLIDLVLLGVEGLELTDEHGNLLEGSALLDAVKNDSDLVGACLDAFTVSVEKKRTKPKTSEAQPANS